MQFKPRIFISSVLTLSKTRLKISDIFKLSGAEPILYEVNLTPSISNATYRQDIIDSDFVIFIFEEKYGTSTDSGKSGTHEEWEIVSNVTIPRHVYIKKSKLRDKKLSTLIKGEINAKNVSYYYYKDEQDLLEHIQSSMFTIAKEIAINNIDNQRISKDVIYRLSFNSDYKDALIFINGFEDILELNRTSEVSFIKTDILNEYLEFWRYQLATNRQLFIDNKLNELFAEIINAGYRHFDYHATHSQPYEQFTVLLPRIPQQLQISWLKLFESFDRTQLKKVTDPLLKTYRIFKKHVFAQKEKFEIRKKLENIA